MKKILFFSLIFLSVPNMATATIYVYKTPNGSSLITDTMRTQPGYQLIRQYGGKTFRSAPMSKAKHFTQKVDSKYDQLITNIALDYGLDPAFVKAVVHVESSFNPNAVSKAGAKGLMQLMPATAKIYNMHDKLFDPSSNLIAGVKHLKELMSRYSNNMTLSLAAYNAGETAVKKYRGVPPYKETQNYVKKVIRLYKVYSKVS